MDPRFLYLKKKKSNVALSTIIHNQLQTPSNITLPTKSHRQPCPFTRSSRISTRPTFLNPQNSLTTPPLPFFLDLHPLPTLLSHSRICGTADSPCSCFGKRGARPDRGWTPREEKKVSISPWTKIAPGTLDRPFHIGTPIHPRRPISFHEMELCRWEVHALAQRRLCSFYLV